jgi:hypothetical protein
MTEGKMDGFRGAGSWGLGNRWAWRLCLGLGEGGGALENLELLQSCELKHSSRSRLLYCSDAPRRDKNVSDLKKPHTYTNASPVSAARPSLGHLLPGGGRGGGLAVGTITLDAPTRGLDPLLGPERPQRMVECAGGKRGDVPLPLRGAAQLLSS